MAHTGLWNQMPEFSPLVQELRGLKVGAPLTKQAEAQLDAVRSQAPYLKNMQPTFDPKHGWIDPNDVVGRIVGSSLGTANTPASSVVADVKRSPVGEWLFRNRNPAVWPANIVKTISEVAANRGIKQAVESLASPDSLQALKKATDYSATGNIVAAIARALAAMQGGSGPASEGAPLSLPRPSFPGIKMEIGGTE